LRKRLAGKVETGLAPIPQGPSGFSINTVNGLTAYYIAAETPHTQACWEWLKFLVTQPTAAAYLPAHIETAHSSAFAEHMGAKFAAHSHTDQSNEQFGLEMVELLLSSVTFSNDQPMHSGFTIDEWYTPGLNWLIVAAEKTAKGDMTLDAAMAEAGEKFTHYRECVVEKQALDDPPGWQACLAQVDPVLVEMYGQ
jgi:ABC-type glycerol-3-phosphate transport system substrate-binding protein